MLILISVYGIQRRAVSTISRYLLSSFIINKSMWKKIPKLAIITMAILLVVLMPTVNTQGAISGVYIDWIKIGSYDSNAPLIEGSQNYNVNWRYRLLSVQKHALMLANYVVPSDKVLSYTIEADCNPTGASIALNLVGQRAAVKYIAFSVFIITETKNYIQLHQTKQTNDVPSSTFSIKFPFTADTTSKRVWLRFSWLTFFDTNQVSQYGYDTTSFSSDPRTGLNLINAESLSGAKLILVLINFSHSEGSHIFIHPGLEIVLSGTDQQIFNKLTPSNQLFHDPVQNGNCFFGFRSKLVFKLPGQSQTIKAQYFQLTNQNIVTAVNTVGLIQYDWRLTCYNVNQQCYNGAAVNDQCVCPDGQFETSTAGVCSACPTGCLRCYSGTRCQSCQQGSFMDLNSELCLANCPTGTYAFEDGPIRQCRPCIQGCGACSDGTTCNQGQCLDGFFFENQVCPACKAECKTCSDALTCDSCLSDTDFFIVHTKQCASQCPEGTYSFVQAEVRECRLCISGCQQCSNGQTCTLCLAEGFFKDQSDICQPCKAQCKTCLNADTCESCLSATDYLLPETKQCVGTCPSGTYPFDDGTVRECRPCLQGCETCSDGSTCDICLEGYYKQNQVCSACVSPCSTCISATQCTGCVQNYYLSGQECFFGCPVRTYETGSNTCAACLFDCYECSNDQTCQTCDATNDHRVLNPDTSRCVPLVGFYETGVTVAGACQEGCLECTSATNCQTCDHKYYFQKDGLCIKKCKAEGEGNPPCKECPEDCLTCNQFGQCTSCPDHLVLNQNSHRCQNTPGNAKRVKASGASGCPQDCVSCQTPFDCSQCISGYQFVSATSKCEPMIAGISAGWIALPSVIAVLAIVVAIVAIVKYSQLKKMNESSQGEDKGSLKSTNAMMKPELDLDDSNKAVSNKKIAEE